jgi:hypothetical protein
MPTPTLSSLTRPLTSTTSPTCGLWWGRHSRDVAVTFYQSATTHQCKVDSHVIVFFTCSLHALRFIYFILINCVMYFVVGCISHCMLEVTVEPG